jgi:DNA-binding Xre family transcriptional regulator
MLEQNLLNIYLKYSAIDKETLNSRVSLAIKKSGYKIIKVADELGITTKTLYTLTKCNPAYKIKFEHLIQICVLLNKSIDDFLRE